MKRSNNKCLVHFNSTLSLEEAVLYQATTMCTTKTQSHLERDLKVLSTHYKKQVLVRTHSGFFDGYG
jgi:hypothetical protein